MEETPHWLRLETSVEIVGDMIAYYNGQLYEEVMKSEKDKALIDELRQKMNILLQECSQCYVEDKQEQIFRRAYLTYGPFLKTKKLELIDRGGVNSRRS